jgi:hypothetical protein
MAKVHFNSSLEMTGVNKRITRISPKPPLCGQKLMFWNPILTPFWEHVTCKKCLAKKLKDTPKGPSE